MCMLCLIPPNVIPSREKLENSALNNPHGFGFAIVIASENRIHAERTMNPDTSINRFLEMRTQYPQDYAIWHARFATHGSTTIDNCHPFMVGGDERTYLAHNGVLPIIEPLGDLRSDTRIFAEDLLPAIGGVSSLDNEQVLNLVEDFTSGSKIAILTLDPLAQFQAYLLHEGKGKRDEDGVWWSNDSCYLYQPSAVQPFHYGLGYQKKSYDYATWDNSPYCYVCDMPVPSMTYETGKDKCPNCYSCLECSTYYKECMCSKASQSKAWDLGW